MNCRRARPELLERSLGRLSPQRERALAAHLARCSGCRAAELAATRLEDGLRSLHTDYPHAIDVTARVAAAVAEMRGLDRREVPGRLAGWAAALAAALCGLSLLALGGWVSSPEVLGTLRGVVRALGGLLAPLAATSLTLISVPFKLLAEGAEALGRLAPLAAWLERLVPPTLLGGVLLMCVIITTVVGRDLLRPAVSRSKGNRRP